MRCNFFENINKKGIYTAILILFMNFMLFGIIGKAEGEKVFFGSESYSWKLGTESPIGVYVSSEQLIEHSEMYLLYDADMLDYKSGGEFIEPGRVKVVAGDGKLQEYSAMIRFVPKMAGETSFTIAEAEGKTEKGDNFKAKNAKVELKVSIPDSVKLRDLQIDGETISEFDTNTVKYQLEVDSGTESLNIKATPEDNSAEVEIDDTTLSEGNNKIYLYVTDSKDNRSRYEINVRKKEVPVEDVAEEVNDAASESDENNTTEAVVLMKSNQNNAIKNRIIIALVILILILILMELLYIEWRIIRQKKRRRYYRQQQENRRKATIQKENTLQDLERGENFENIEEFPLVDNRENEIVVKNVTMEFTREKDEATSLKELFVRTMKRQRVAEKFKALDDVSFNVKQGDVLGIIGTNGSGKSTILKIISGALQPTSGKVEVDQSKIQLLTLGTGFDYELTGRENVYLNGAIIGYSREFIDEKYDEIVKFAELEGFMEQKVRNYSSGMVSRLGFAIATVRDTPEILILDEVLSVGDMFFRKKSNVRIKEMMRGGSTVLIVSHSTTVIRENCTKAIWIEKGHLKAVGNPAEVCKAYEKMNG